MAISTLRVSKRHAKSPTFSLFFEFLDPTSNICFIQYYPGRNLFATFDFGENILNPITRAQAAANKEYAVSFKRRTFQAADMEDWRTKDLNKVW